MNPQKFPQSFSANTLAQGSVIHAFLILVCRVLLLPIVTVIVY